MKRRDYPFWASMSTGEKIRYVMEDHWGWVKWLLLPLLVLVGCFLGVGMCRALDWLVRTIL